MKKPLKIGSKLFMVRDDCYTINKPKVLMPVSVTKVGRKYFTVESGHGFTCDFTKESWIERGNYSPTFYLYESEQDLQDEIEKKKIHGSIQAFFNNYRSRQMALEPLRSIHSIIQGFQNVC